MDLPRAATFISATESSQLGLLQARLERREEQLHELRASFAAVVSAVRLLSHHGDHLSSDNGRRLAALLDSELARLERLGDERHPDTPVVLALDDVIQPVVDLHRAAGQQIHWEPSGRWVRAVADDLAEVISVLLVNAHRHAGASPVWITVEKRGAHVCMRVTDKGPGVPWHLHETVLRRGVRGSGSDGHGLGLYMAHRLIADQGGIFRLVPSEIGAVFEIVLVDSHTRVSA